MEIQIVKAGWMQRKSSVLHRWKKNWFVLYRTGELTYFESQDKCQPEGRFLVFASCIAIKTRGECDFCGPEAGSKQSLLHLMLRQHEDLKLCAESPDDMRAWQLALEEARTMNSTGVTAAAPGVTIPPGSQVVYPQTIPPGSQVVYPQTFRHGGHVIAQPGQYCVRDASGNQTMVMGNQPGQVVCVQEPYSYGRRYYSPMLMGPMLWW